MISRTIAGANVSARFEVKIEDAWVGVYWRKTPCLTDDGPKTIATDIWICVIPCLPLHLTISWPIVIPFGGEAAR